MRFKIEYSFVLSFKNMHLDLLFTKSQPLKKQHKSNFVKFGIQILLME